MDKLDELFAIPESQLSDWERKFVESMAKMRKGYGPRAWGALSAKQRNRVKEIVEKYK